jgi:hypothetical protein
MVGRAAGVEPGCATCKLVRRPSWRLSHPCACFLQPGGRYHKVFVQEEGIEGLSFVAVHAMYCQCAGAM